MENENGVSHGAERRCQSSCWGTDCGLYAVIVTQRQARRLTLCSCVAAPPGPHPQRLHLVQSRLPNLGTLFFSRPLSVPLCHPIYPTSFHSSLFENYHSCSWYPCSETDFSCPDLHPASTFRAPSESLYHLAPSPAPVLCPCLSTDCTHRHLSFACWTRGHGHVYLDCHSLDAFAISQLRQPLQRVCASPPSLELRVGA